MTLFGRQSITLTLIVCSICLVLLGQVGLTTGPIRALAGIVVTVFVPGYAALAVARPRHLTHATRLIVSVPLSLSIVIAIGVILDHTSIGIRPTAMAVAVAAVSLFLATTAWWRGRTGAPARPSIVLQHRAAFLRTRPVVPAILLVLMAICGFWATQEIMLASHDVPMDFTELYVKGITVAASKVDRSVEATVLLGINNRENRIMEYTLRSLTPAGNGKMVMASEQTIQMHGDQQWSGSVQIRIVCGSPVEAQLWLHGGHEPYRMIRLRPVCPAPVASLPKHQG